MIEMIKINKEFKANLNNNKETKYKNNNNTKK
jgi:hypothetical protein